MANSRTFFCLMGLFFISIFGGILFSSGKPYSPISISDISPDLPGFPLEMATLKNSILGKHLTAQIYDPSGILSKAAMIRIVMGTYSKQASPKYIQIVDPRTNLVIFHRGNGTIKNNTEIELMRTPDAPSTFPPSQHYTLEAMVAHDNALAIWTQRPNTDPKETQSNILVSTTTQSGILRGTWALPAKVPPLSRIELLYSIWNGNKLVYLGISSGVILILISLLIFFSKNHQTWSYAFFFLGSTFLYINLSPPFQAPDEPDHFLTFIESSPNKSLLNTKALELANSGHFEAIKFNQNINFSTENIGSPLNLPWAHHINPISSPSLRSPLTSIVWPILAKYLALDSASTLLIALRAINGVVLSLSFFYFLALLPIPARSTIGPLFLSLPTISFFGMGVSNYCYLISASIISTGFIAKSLTDRQLKSRHFIVWGIISGVLFVSGIAGFVGWFVNFLFASFTIMFAKPEFKALKSSMIFAFSNLIVILAISNQLYFNNLMSSIEYLYPYISGLNLGESFAVLLVTTELFWFFLVNTIRNFIIQLQIFKTPKFRRRCIALAQTETFILVGLFLFSGFYRFEPLPNIENTRHGITAATYAAKCLILFIQSFGLGESDGLLVKSFWGGFGWLDSMPSEPFFYIMRAISLGGILCLFVLASCGKSLRAWAWVHLGGLLSAIFISLLAIGTFRAQANLHGRYLIEFYLFALLFSWLGYLELYKLLSFIHKKVLTVLIFCFAVATHVYCWSHLLVRYFG